MTAATLGWERDLSYEEEAHRRMRAGGWPEEVPLPVAYARGDLRALVGREPIDVALRDPRWHVSVQGPGRIPEWAELVDACHALRPGVVFAAAIPPANFWVNINPNVLHAWEIHDAPLVASWLEQGRERQDQRTR